MPADHRAALFAISAYKKFHAMFIYMFDDFIADFISKNVKFQNNVSKMLTIP